MPSSRPVRPVVLTLSVGTYKAPSLEIEKNVGWTNPTDCTAYGSSNFVCTSVGMIFPFGPTCGPLGGTRQYPLLVAKGGRDPDPRRRETAIVRHIERGSVKPRPSLRVAAASVPPHFGWRGRARPCGPSEMGNDHQILLHACRRHLCADRTSAVDPDCDGMVHHLEWRRCAVLGELDCRHRGGRVELRRLPRRHARLKAGASASRQARAFRRPDKALRSDFAQLLQAWAIAGGANVFQSNCCI